MQLRQRQRVGVVRSMGARLGLRAPETDAHAGGLETSMMLAAFPEDRSKASPAIPRPRKAGSSASSSRACARSARRAFSATSRERVPRPVRRSSPPLPTSWLPSSRASSTPGRAEGGVHQSIFALPTYRLVTRVVCATSKGVGSGPGSNPRLNEHGTGLMITTNSQRSPGTPHDEPAEVHRDDQSMSPSRISIQRVFGVTDRPPSLPLLTSASQRSAAWLFAD
jgi:hypothetical protein